MTLIQITPLKINPWSAIVKLLGKGLNADVLKEIENIKNKQQEIQKTLNDHIVEDDERDTNTKRNRILRFNADLMNGTNFTHEYFCEILAEIDQYEQYCKTHPNYRNNWCSLAISNIVRVCEDHEQNNSFLK